MTTFTATNTAELLNFVSAAASGDTILLAPGSYSGVMIQNLAKAGNVTITSADPTNEAVFYDLTLRYCQGLTFSNIDMFATKDMPFQVQNSSRITLDSLDVHGSLNGSSNDDYRGMLIRNSSYVTVSNSHFHELTDALSHSNSQYVTFADNRFDIIRDNGVAGGGSSHMTVSGNVFSDFDHVGAVHPDAIQFWTSGTSAAAIDITVTGNVFNRGSGVAIQGIFINDEVGNLPYQQVSVTNNVIVGGAYNGIQIQGAIDATMTGNMVLEEPDQASWLGIRNVARATISDNIVSNLSFGYSTTTGTGDVLPTDLDFASAASASAWLNSNAITGQLSGIAAQFKALLLSSVNLTGYIDGVSQTGLSYSFTVVQVDGTSGADRLVAGTVGSYHVSGYDGNDAISGGTNGISCTLEGGLGDDTYVLYQANDLIVENPGEGNDAVQSYVNYTLAANVENVTAMSAGLTLHGNAANNTLIANAGGDTLYGDLGDDLVQGGAGNDVLYGEDGIDRLLGYDGNDTLDGGNGNDSLYGGNGNDIMIGGAGNDYFEGGTGLDTMTGGLGSDTFTFRQADFAAGLNPSKDIITDFSASQGDKISISAIDANTKIAGDQAFTFIGNQAFHGVAGELRYVAETDGITIYGDTNGDRVADIGIHLRGLSSITSSSFVL